MPTTTFRGRTITDRDVLDAMAKFDRDERATFTRWKTYAIKHAGNQYPPKHILRLMVGDFPKLFGGEPTNRVIEDALDTTLHLESDLEGFLVADLDKLEMGLQLYVANETRGQASDPVARVQEARCDHGRGCPAGEE